MAACANETMIGIDIMAELTEGPPLWIQNDDVEEGDHPGCENVFYAESVDWSNDTVRAWFLAEAVDRTKGKYAAWPWDFSLQCVTEAEMKRVYIRKDIKLGQDESYTVIKDIRAHKFATAMERFKVPKVRRVAGDREVTYGDGGNSFLVYPLYVCDAPDILESERLDLVEDLSALAVERGDLQEGSPVEDIIDPDLNPRLLPLHQRNANAMRFADIQWRLDRVPDSIHLGSHDWNFYREYKRFAHEASEPATFRQTYSWIPSEFLVRGNGDVVLNSPIHNLPPTQAYRRLHKGITKAFKALVPLFAELHLVNEGVDTKLQVVVKAQRYTLQPGMSYSGRWHMEGQSEHIVGVGVYYCQVEEGLQGGQLKFRPDDCPQDFYDIVTDVEVPTAQNTAVAFSNTLPHRFRTIKNETSSVLHRTFLTFFVISPAFPLPSTLTVPSNSTIEHILNQAFVTHTGRTMPDLVWHNILFFLSEIGTAREAKAYRARARAAMTRQHSGWGYICWGNCGVTIFGNSYEDYPQRLKDEARELVHTESAASAHA